MPSSEYVLIPVVYGRLSHIRSGRGVVRFKFIFVLLRNRGVVGMYSVNATFYERIYPGD